MAHVFVAPHPDDAALSCGGLIALLRERGQAVTVLTLFSGTGGAERLTPYQREALGFGAEPAGPSAGAPGAPGAGPSAALSDAAAAAGAMALRRLEDERFAALAGVATEFLDLPDAVFRGYEGDAQLFSAPRADDPAPAGLLRRELARLGPSRVYFPLGVGRHVDHQLARDAGLALLAGDPSWAAPSAGAAARLAFYEDFPYAHRVGFAGLGDLPPGALAALPAGVSLEAEYVDVAGALERKVGGVARYESQMDRLFGGAGAMAEAVRAYATRVAAAGSVPSGAAERYWAPRRA